MLISLLQFFFIKCSNNFFTIEIINNICSWNSIFYFTNNKTFFRPVWCVSFSKNVFVFWNSYMITNFKFRIFTINFFTRVNICIIFNIYRFYLSCSVICIVVFIYINFLKELFLNSLPLTTHIFFGFLVESSNIFWNALTMVIAFLSFKGTTQAYLPKISITNNKNLNPLLNLLINCISAKSTPQMLSLNPEWTVLF